MFSSPHLQDDSMLALPKVTTMIQCAASAEDHGRHGSHRFDHRATKSLGGPALAHNHHRLKLVQCQAFTPHQQVGASSWLSCLRALHAAVSTTTCPAHSMSTSKLEGLMS
eukprot:6471986-Amphidinium_carterae.2